jgi:predicted membrane channel-forming protein YqfA (hemolysin III family)
MFRLSTFVATGLSGLLPIIHAASIYPYAQLNQQAGLGYYLVEGLALIIGVVFYAVSERVHASAQPRKEGGVEPS